MKNLLTKTCIICGEKKPLAAFLRMCDSQGTTYGNICTACRGPDATPNETITFTEEDDDATGSGYRIDSDHRNFAEMQDKERLELDFELAEEALEKKNQLDSEKNELTEQKEKAEKEHRAFLEAKKKRSFLSFPSNKGDQSATFASEVILEEKIKNDIITQSSEIQKNIDLQNDIEKNRFLIESDRIKNPDTQDALDAGFTPDKNTQTSTQGVRSHSKIQEVKRTQQKLHNQEEVLKKQNATKKLFTDKKAVEKKVLENSPKVQKWLNNTPSHIKTFEASQPQNPTEHHEASKPTNSFKKSH